MIDNNLGFVILSPSMNYGGLRTTINTIKANFPEAPYIVSIAENMDKKDQEEVKKMAPTVVAKSSVTALINKGIKQSKKDWICIVMSGSFVRYEILKKYRTFIKSDTDIGYPVANLKSWRFEESSLNGLFLNRKTFNKVGPFAENEHSLEICRLFWALDAIEKGCQFKGLVGVKIC